MWRNRTACALIAEHMLKFGRGANLMRDQYSSLRLNSVLFFTLSLGSFACGSSDESAGGTTGSAPAASTCSVAGTYDGVQKRTGGSCGDPIPAVGSEIATNFNVTVSGKNATVVIQGLQGACPGTVNGCKITGACEVRTSGAVSQTANFTFTINGNAVTGSSANTFYPPTVSSTCTANFNITASSK